MDHKRDRPLSFLAAWVGAASLLLAAVLLQRQLWLDQSDLGPFWWLLGVAALFAVVATVGLPDDDERQPRSAVQSERRDDTPSAGVTPLRGTALLGLAVACEIAALAFFPSRGPSLASWLHLVAATLFLGGAWSSSRTDRRHLAGSWSRLDTACLVGLMVLATVPRAWQLGSVPEGVWFDEAQRGLEALRMEAEPRYRPVWATGVLQEPTGFWYLLLPFVQWLGRDPLALRIPPAVGGVLGVGAVYLLARALFDRRSALVAAGLMVGLTWHLNYSRIAFPAVWSVTLDTLATAFFALGLRRQTVFPFAAAGVVAGAALYFYYTSQLLPVILTAVLLHRLVGGRLPFLRGCGVGLVACAVGFVIAAAPLVQYAVLHPRELSARAGTVSVLKEVEEAESWQPLVNNVRAHLLMFNVRGDPNGRHNWSGRPMLDGVTGGLAVLGLALALTRWRRWEYGLPLAWLPIALTGGILSISWEAPQSHRAVGEITAVVLLAALPLRLLWRTSDRLPDAVAEARRRLRPIGNLELAAGHRSVSGRPAVALAVGGLVVATSTFNVWTYFERQQPDFRTWMEFQTPQTEVARQINALPPDERVYLDPVYMGHPTIDLLVRRPRQYSAFDPAAHLPLPEAAAVFLSERYSTLAARVGELYPHAIKQVLRPPASGHVALTSFRVTPADVAANRGVVAHFEGSDGTAERREEDLTFDWPSEGSVAVPFGVRLETTLAVPTYGPYRLHLEAPADAALVIDGAPIVTGGREARVELARGPHALRLVVPSAGQEPLRLLWAQGNAPLVPVPASALHVPPIRATGLLAQLYRGREPGGRPAIQQIDPNVELRVHLLPLARPYTIEWSGSVRADRDGVYHFGTSSVDASAVWVDGRQVVANTTPNAYVDGSLLLTAGWHDLRVRFLDASNFSHVTLFWQPPGEGRAIVPSQALRPWPAERVAVAQLEDGAAGDRLSVSASPIGTVPVGPASNGVGTPAAGLRPGPAVTNVRALSAAGTLVEPRGVAVGSDGTVYVADAGRAAVVALPANGGRPRVLAEGRFLEPSAVAALADGSVVVVDAAGAIHRLGPDGTPAEQLAVDQDLYSPRGVSAALDGRLVVADTGRNRLLLLEPAGGVRGIAGLDQPTDAAFLPDGSLLVAETGASLLTIVNLDGRRLATWPMPAANTVHGPHLVTLPDGGLACHRAREWGPHPPGIWRSEPGDPVR